jgi:hypothetical protein
MTTLVFKLYSLSQRAYCTGMTCQAKHRLWECCTTGTATCQQCAPLETYLKLSSVLSTYVCSHMHGNDQTQHSHCLGLLESSRTLMYSTTATYIAAARLPHVQQNNICSIGVRGGYSYIALLAAAPTANVVIFDEQPDPYARLVVDALKQLFPRAALQLITGTSDQSVVDVVSTQANITCSVVLAHSATDVISLKELVDINWHMIIQDQVSSSSAVQQVWSDAVENKFIKKYTLMSALLLPNAAQHSKWYNALDSDGVRAIGIRFQPSYSDVYVGQYVHGR